MRPFFAALAVGSAGMSDLDENGFLGGRIESWVKEHRARNDGLIELAEALNRESHAFLHGRTIGIDDTRRLTSVVLFARMLELYQAVLLGAYRGLRSGTRVLFRAFLEAFFHFAAIRKDVEYLNEYLDQFENDRKTLINRIRHSDDPTLAHLKQPIDDQLVAQIQNIDIRRVNIEEVARRGGCHNIYVTAYALLSGSVHSSARDLEAHLRFDVDRETIIGFLYGPTDEETSRTVGLAGITLANAFGEISKDFEEERTESCKRFVASFTSYLAIEPQESN